MHCVPRYGGGEGFPALVSVLPAKTKCVILLAYKRKYPKSSIIQGVRCLMMKQMRENTKIILWVVVVAFVVTIFAVWGLDLQTGGPGQGQTNVLGKVNGVPITRSQYQSVYDQIAAQYRAATENGRLTNIQRDMIWDQAWENIVVGILTDQQIKKLGIEVTDQEIISYLRTSPPPEIRQYFRDKDGNFDYNAYLQALNNPDADWTGVEALARQRIPTLKLNQYLMAQVHVSNDEITKAYEERNTKLLVEYVEFPLAAEDVSDYTPTDEDIKAYYDEHADRFQVAERAVLEYVKIPIEPTARDVEDVMFTIGTLHAQLLAGEDFGVLANTYSEAPTADVNGETGFLVRSQRNAEVMDVLDGMKPEQVSDPIKTDDGVYLVKLLATKKENGEKKYNFQEIYLQFSAGSTTADSLVAAAQNIQRRAADTSLLQAAEENGKAVEKTEPFIKDFPIPGIGFVPSLSRFAFSGAVGALSNVLSDENGYYVCRIAERIPAGLKPMESVKEEIKADVLLERQKLMARRKAEGFHTKLVTSRQSFGDAAGTYGHKVQRPDSFTVSEGAGEIPPYSPFAYAAFDLSDDTNSPPIESHGAFFVIHLVGRAKLEDEALRLAAERIGSELYQKKIQDYIIYWYDNLKAESNIEDYRGAF